MKSNKLIELAAAGVRQISCRFYDEVVPFGTQTIYQSPETDRILTGEDAVKAVPPVFLEVLKCYEQRWGGQKNVTKVSLREDGTVRDIYTETPTKREGAPRDSQTIVYRDLMQGPNGWWGVKGLTGAAFQQDANGNLCAMAGAFNGPQTKDEIFAELDAKDPKTKTPAQYQKYWANFVGSCLTGAGEFAAITRDEHTERRVTALGHVARVFGYTEGMPRRPFGF